MGRGESTIAARTTSSGQFRPVCNKRTRTLCTQTVVDGTRYLAEECARAVFTVHEEVQQTRGEASMAFYQAANNTQVHHQAIEHNV